MHSKYSLRDILSRGTYAVEFRKSTIEEIIALDDTLNYQSLNAKDIFNLTDGADDFMVVFEKDLIPMKIGVTYIFTNYNELSDKDKTRFARKIKGLHELYDIQFTFIMNNVGEDILMRYEPDMRGRTKVYEDTKKV